MKKIIKTILAISIITSINIGNTYASVAATTDFTTMITSATGNYALVSLTKTGRNVYKDFSGALNSGYSTIMVDEGTFNISDTVTITKDYVSIIGASKDSSKLVMTNSGKDLMRVYANNVTIKNLTLDTKTYNAQAAFVVGDGNKDETNNEKQAGNYVTLDGCNVLGGDRTFTLYYAGPTYRESIYKKYSQGKLSNGNIIRNNYFEGSFIRDTFVFGLQMYGSVENNTFVGGELDAYMVVNSKITGNTFKDSNKTGIFISGPSYKLSITNNIITGMKEHGIKSFYSIDNLPIPEDLKYIKYTTISGNNISNTGETGIDLNYFISGTVYGNNISNAGVHGISLITNSYKNTISSNVISEFGQAKRFRGSGIFATVNSTNNNINGNIISTNKNYLEYAGIFIETPDSTGSSVSGNTISGSFENAGIFSYTKEIKVTNNKITNYSGIDILYK